MIGLDHPANRGIVSYLRSRPSAITAGAQTQRPYPAYPELKIAASMLDLATFGPEWVFGAWLDGEREWCLAAFKHAAQTI